ncbi:MAG: YfiR family protein [Bdellovibrionota bacterium]
MSVIVALLIAGMALPTVGRAQEGVQGVPVTIQVAILFKVLSLDKNVARKGAEELKVCVVFDSRNAESKKSREEFEAAVGAGKKVAGLTILLHSFDLASGKPLASYLRETNTGALYATSGLGAQAEKIAEAAREAQATATAGEAALVEQGLATGVEAQDNKPRIVINLSASKAQGADFSSEVLKLARITGK